MEKRLTPYGKKEMILEKRLTPNVQNIKDKINGEKINSLWKKKIR